MRARRSGIIVNISSTAGIEAKPSRTMYSGSKFAIEAFSEALYHELKPFNVRVLLVEPGWFRSVFSENVTLGGNEKELPKDYDGTALGLMIEGAKKMQGAKAPVSWNLTSLLDAHSWL
jgi:short-subunit dehydrogenase